LVRYIRESNGIRGGIQMRIEMAAEIEWKEVNSNEIWWSNNFWLNFKFVIQYIDPLKYKTKRIRQLKNKYFLTLTWDGIKHSNFFEYRYKTLESAQQKASELLNKKSKKIRWMFLEVEE